MADQDPFRLSPAAGTGAQTNPIQRPSSARSDRVPVFRHHAPAEDPANITEPDLGPDSSDEQLSASRKAHGFVAYFARPTIDAVGRMETSRMCVSDLALSDKGITKMNEQWKDKAPFQATDKPQYRWIHLPANNPHWVEGSIYRIMHNIVKEKDPSWKTDDNFAKDAVRQILRPEYWADQQNKSLADVHHSRFMKPFCRKMGDVPKSPNKLGANKHLTFMMPYLHWESTGEYRNMRQLFARDVTNEIKNRDADSALMHEYLSGSSALHIRRTLDQSYYSTLGDTSDRDKDQVVQRYTEGKLKLPKPIQPMLMVDQCWLWILGGDTVLTAFPQQWSCQDPSGVPLDSTDVQNGILEFLYLKSNRKKVSDAKTLAYLIIDRCACNIFDPDSITWPELQFMRFFNDSIDELMIAQTKSLKKLWSDVKAISGNKPIDDSLFDMVDDFDTLEKIKDIQEELLMLNHVMRQQRKSLKLLKSEELNPLEGQMLNVASSRGGSFNEGDRQQTRNNQTLGLPRRGTAPSSPPRPASEPANDVAVHDEPSGDEGPTKPKNEISEKLAEVLRRAKEREADLLTLTEKADATYRALHDLLDLKQRQARLSEARQARKSAEELEEQSNSIMLFTVVTILFLPLSSLASIFGINAKEFGQGQVTLRLIFIYIFPISTFVVLISFLLAFNHNLRKVLLKWLEIGGAYLFFWFPTASVEKYVDDLEKKLKAIRARKKGTVDAPEAEAVPEAKVEKVGQAQRAGQQNTANGRVQVGRSEQVGQSQRAGQKNAANGDVQVGRGARRRSVDVEQQAAPTPSV